MKRVLLIYIAFFISAAVKVFSQEPIVLNLYVEDDYQKKTILYGLNTEATTGKDVHLDEDDLPGPGPGEDIYAVFLFNDPPQDNAEIQSYKDYRPFPEIDGDTVIYHVWITNINGKLKVSWDKMPEQVDSAFIGDFAYEMALFKYDMKNELSFENENLTEVDLLIYLYLKDGNNVTDENNNNKELNIYPNPANSDLNILNTIPGSKYSIRDITGRNIQSGIISSDAGSVNIENLIPGVYNVLINTPNGRLWTKKFIKI